MSEEILTPKWAPTPLPRTVFPKPTKTSSGQDIYEVKLYLPKNELMSMKEHGQKNLNCCMAKKKYLWQTQVVDAYERFQIANATKVHSENI